MPNQELSSLMAAVANLEAEARRATDSPPLGAVGVRLRDSVLRPLGQAESRRQAGSRGQAGSLADRLWELAQAATVLLVRSPDQPGLGEATAALQDLAIGLADPASAADRLEALAALQAGLEPQIRVAQDGPYLVTNAGDLRDGLGQPLPMRAAAGPVPVRRLGDQAVLRRQRTPGTGLPAPRTRNRVPDQRDSYTGQQVTIFDNRGICQHPGLCTDRLATVFRTGAEPFVAPSGGRMDEIIRAVRDCPSGALSLAFDEQEARDLVDWHGRREPGDRGHPGRAVPGDRRRSRWPDAAGEDRCRRARARPASTTRCAGAGTRRTSRSAAACTGTSVPRSGAGTGREPTLFEWAGGLPALTRMTRLLYEKHVPADALLAPLFATMPADHPQRVAKWLAEVFGGPKAYSQEYGGYSRMISQHVGKGLTEEQRGRWVALLLQSAHDAGLPNDAEFRSALGSYIEWGSRLAVENSQAGARPPEHMPMPRWDWHTAAGPPGSRISALAPPEEEAAPSCPPPVSRSASSGTSGRCSGPVTGSR